MSTEEKDEPTGVIVSREYPKIWPGFYALPWIVPALTSLRLKQVIMAGTLSYGSGGFSIAAQPLGEHSLGFWEKLTFFSLDIIVAAVVPVVLIAVTRLLPVRWRLPFVTLFSAAVALALYAQMRAFEVVGQFLSFRMFLTAINWGLHEPKAYLSYLGGKGLLVLGGAILALVGLWWFSRGPTEQPQVFRTAPIKRFGVGSEGLFLLCLLLIGAVSGLRNVGLTGYHGSILLKALRAYWQRDQIQIGEFVGLSTSELLLRYQQITAAPVPKRDPAYWGKATGNNILFFVLETTPARFLPPDGEMDDLPNLRTLREHSFVGLHHHTTFPRTHESAFSLLTSWYPSDVTRTFEEQYPDIRVPGMMRSLSGSGYSTAIYSSRRGGHLLDEEMFQEVGVERQVYPPDSLAPPEGPLREEWQRTRLARDLATLHLLKQDIARSLAERRKFAAVFLPQISHIPYPDVPANRDEHDMQKRARAILRIEDAWLGEILQLLEESHQLDHTVIVITGDHGIRSSEEDPTFRGGMLDEYSFHVPLLIYAPQALRQTVTIPWVTSHIDVAPTVLDLLGMERGREFEEGASIWTAELAQRQTYFLANSLFGADGYYAGGRFYMRNAMSDSVYASSAQHFVTSDMIPTHSPQHKQVCDAVARIAGLQQVAAARFSPTPKVRSYLDPDPEPAAAK